MLQATELRTADSARARTSYEQQHARKVLSRLAPFHTLRGIRILDIGSAQGLFVAACKELGYDAIGVEPLAGARDVAASLTAERGDDVVILNGTAESLPVHSASFDVVHAKSVIEHVDDPRKAFSEAYRVLRSGGIFWFNTASSMCPIQSEIRGFPGFGWYPDPLKRAIMTWAIRNRPQSIGHTSRPAYHWFTPWKARRMLKEAGFRIVLDRWDLRRTTEGSKFARYVLPVIRATAVTKLLADVAVPGCSYAAIK
ncbi:MAG TPA: class I SAM-dependent methyltransferase [Candidatus Aquilonibacter sp.]|nr:class I SAM-dependent methyltransferase [Candidatus Aquilonibacter sp.]